MRKSIFAALAVALAMTFGIGSAFACGKQGCPPDKPPVVTPSQAQGQAQGQGQMQGQTSINNNENTAMAGAAAAASASSALSSKIDVDNYNSFMANIDNKSSQSTSQANRQTNNQTTTFTSPDNITIKNVPNVSTGNVYPTSPCMGSSQAGASGVGFGLSFGSSWTDDECGIRETARSFSGMDMKDDALAVLCSSKYAAAAPSCKKLTK